MSQEPDALLENLTPEDRHLLDKKLNQRLTAATAVFVPVVVIAAGAIYYANTSMADTIDESVLGFMNLFFVLAGLLPGRLYVNHVISFFKDKNSYQKKVYRGTVTKVEGPVVRINTHELKIGKEYTRKLQQGMQAEVHLSMRSNIILSIIASPQ